MEGTLKNGWVVQLACDVILLYDVIYGINVFFPGILFGRKIKILSHSPHSHTSVSQIYSLPLIRNIGDKVCLNIYISKTKIWTYPSKSSAPL